MAALIGQRRSKLGLTLADIAKVLGITQPAVAHYTSSYFPNWPRVEHLLRLCALLQLTPNELLGWPKDGSQPIEGMPAFLTLPGCSGACPGAGIGKTGGGGHFVLCACHEAVQGPVFAKEKDARLDWEGKVLARIKARETAARAVRDL
jgi:hypothetical protein